jgi:folate-binding protein YgfZ
LANRYVILESRAIVRVAGDDARSFLQGLVSQDIATVTPAHAAYGAFLTPQGKYLHDFCLAELDGAILLECEAARSEDLAARLARYRLRAAVNVAVDPDFIVAAIFGESPLAGTEDKPGAARAFANGVLFADPRHIGVGWRAILPRIDAIAALETAGFVAGDPAEYEARRIALTIPDGSRDLEIDRTILLEANFDRLNGVSWDKGCYMGQELTARTKYRGLIKKRLVTVSIDGSAPVSGTPIEQNGREVGVVRSSAGNQAIALLRIEAINDATGSELHAGDRVVSLS